MSAKPAILRVFLHLLAVSGTVSVIAGCRTLVERRGSESVQFDRLMAAYPELQGGRFAVIADFEDPKHMEIFSLISVSGKAKCVLGGRRGRRQTGPSCARFTAGSEHDTVVINNDTATNWYLKRDWRDFDLLLMSIKAPQPDLTVELSIAAGPVDRRLAIVTPLRLQRGWNVVRLDLADVGERIPLDDVQDLRLSVQNVRNPVRLILDDIILTGSREDLFGDSQNRTGELYIQRVGRRWNIGAGGRFELTFANGQIVRWHNLAADPYRMRNIVQGTTLGPSPVVLDSTGEMSPDLGGLGDQVIAKSQILEMNPVRAVVKCEWRFVNEPDAPADDRPFRRWVYTIYPTGQIYAAAECTANTAAWTASQLGLAVAVATGVEGEVSTRVSPDPASHSATAGATYALARNAHADALLMYVPWIEKADLELIEELEPDRRRASFIAVVPPVDEDVASWRSHLFVADSRNVTDEEAHDRAVDYATPASVDLELGSLGTGKGAAMSDNEIDPSTGCYTIVPDHGRVRFTIDGQDKPRFSPVFRIVSTPRQEAWVYVNHLVFDEVARDREGALIFQLPGIVRGQTLIEVLFRRPENFSGA
ncbi:MAG: hypothetical protein JSU63_19210 [Phycisphaerales bacterium]|nr:MAG: hypothetical protein JSU63_19210 [Phycisphaerales bacterium]